MIIDMMSKDLKLTRKQIQKMLGNGNAYKKYKIKKKNSTQLRTIYHPSSDLKKLQYWIVENIIKKYPVSEFSTAYEKGCSISQNAKIHCKNSFILHTDITSFFESINSKHIEELLLQDSSTVYTEEDLRFIEKIVLCKGTLTVGSVSSPAIANRVMYKFDNNLYESINKIGEFNYSRYADDLIISSRHYIPEEVLEIIDRELLKLNMNRNLEKTYFASKKMKRQINGIVLDNNSNKLSYGTERLKMMKNELYEYVTKSTPGEEEKARIKGELAFLKDINEVQYHSLIKKYKKYKYGDRL